MGLARERSGGFAVPTLLVVGVLASATLLVGANRWIYRREIAAVAAGPTR
jgi:hypothetical protein